MQVSLGSEKSFNERVKAGLVHSNFSRSPMTPASEKLDIKKFGFVLLTWTALMDPAVSADHRVTVKESEKLDKY